VAGDAFAEPGAAVRPFGGDDRVHRRVAQAALLTGAQERDQLRRTPSNVAPTLAMAARERWLRASVLRSTRSADQWVKAWSNSSSLASALMPVPWAEAASQVKPISIADRAVPSGRRRGSQYAVAPTARPVRLEICA
jgi:hypothetical protein